ncbi:unnamed protein product [Pseudo-nitzschia multistriata]|uniref:Uncharacterized protein n=1 Tax=Pseudo-nitzschia multistriata TaxID=183589 RepID=A0A448ZA21_9STRA|nr:unnamed protein product [Pseudo-nitzschia multistriata]
MGSAAEVLAEEGKIIISLCEGQGGFPASTAEEWKRSWLVPQYAAGHGLLLHKLKQYDPMYQQTSHRGKDRPWIKDGTDQRYIFGFPNEGCIDEDLQISCRHELRVVLPKDFVEGSAVGRQEIIEGDAVFQLTKGFVPDGIRMEVVTREILYPYFFDNEEVTLAIFLLNYSGEKAPLTRESADTIRSKVEASVQQDWNLKVAKSGRLVSRPYPTHLLPALIRESSERNLTLTNSSP